MKKILLLLIAPIFLLSTCQQGSNQYNASEVVLCSDEEGFTNGIKHLLGHSNRSIYLLKSNLEPITGEIITYENGIPKYETHYKNGIQVGLSRSWYANGKKEAEESLGYGKYGGQKLIAQKFWDENGIEKRMLWSDLNIENTIYTGTLYEIYPDGKIKYEATYKNGRANLGKAWHRNGQLKMETDYPYMQDHWDYAGEIYNWDENGKILYYQEASAGASLSLYFDQNGHELEWNELKSDSAYFTHINATNNSEMRCENNMDLRDSIFVLGENPIEDLIAQKIKLLTKTNFIKKNENSVWTNGIDTLSFEFETTEKLNKIELFTFNGIEYKTKPSSIECCMCSNAWMDLSSEDTLILINESTDDFGGFESLENTFYLEETNLIQIIDYEYEYKAPPYTLIWILKTSSSGQINDITDLNKAVIEQFKVQKESIRRRYVNTIDL
jgi:antitoxin component YwqK of YwqJK toxin-antitoxin module